MAAAVAAVGSMFTAVVVFAVVITICPCIDKLTAQIRINCFIGVSGCTGTKLDTFFRKSSLRSAANAAAD